MTNKNALKPGVLIHRRYEILGILGIGGQGFVYSVRDVLMERFVALKEFFPDSYCERVDGCKVIPVTQDYHGKENFENLKSQFYEEAKFLDSLFGKDGRASSDNSFMRIYDYFEENGTAYVVMEWLVGLTLKELLKTGSMSVPLSLDIISGVLRGLGTLHGIGLIHCDICPGNIIVECHNGQQNEAAEGRSLPDDTVVDRVMIIDFGLVTEMTNESGQNESRLSVILTPGYAPPEQYSESGTQGAWSDVYAAGATLYRMVTGKRPPESIDRIMHDTINIANLKKSGIDEKLAYIITKAMALNWRERYRNAGDFLGDITAYRRIAERSSLTPGKEERTFKNNPVWKIGAFVLAFIMIYFALSVWERFWM